MSFFRPDSPPPRQPSPDILPAPLPHPRHQTSHPRIRVDSPRSHGRFLRAMHSMDLTSERATMARGPGGGPAWTNQRTQSTHTSSSTPTPRSSPGISPCPSPTSHAPSPVGYKRALSVSIPSPAPSPTPTMVSLFPPPSKSGACASNGIACPQPVSLKRIVFEQTEGLGVTDRRPTTHLLEKPSQSSLRSLPPPLDKPKNVGIACLRFFGIKSNPKQESSDVAGL